MSSHILPLSETEVVKHWVHSKTEGVQIPEFGKGNIFNQELCENEQSLSQMGAINYGSTNPTANKTSLTFCFCYLPLRRKANGFFDAIVGHLTFSRPYHFLKHSRSPNVNDCFNKRTDCFISPETSTGFYSTTA